MSDKKVSWQRVDDLLQKSIFMRLTSQGHEIYSRLDKMAFVSDLSEEDNEVLFKRLGEMKTTQVYSIKNRKMSKRECGELYHRALEIRLTSKPKGHPVALVIHYRPTSKQRRKTSDVTHRGAVRMELSPQHYTAEELTALFLWLGKKVQLGRYLYLALKKAWITNIHYALDIVGMRLRDYYLRLRGSSCGKVFVPDNGMEGIRIGGKKSECYAACYEKVDVVRSEEGENYGQQSLLVLKSDQYRDFVRFELRLSPGKGEMLLKHINKMENLLSRLTFYSRELRNDPRLDPALAVLLDKGMSISQAFGEHKSSAVVNGKNVSSTKKQAGKRLDRLLKKYRVPLFDAEAIWDRLPLVLDTLGILSQPQHWELKHRQKWLKSRGK